MNKILFILAITLSLVVIKPATASDFMLGLSFGPALGFDVDFNKNKIKTKPHLVLGLESLYKLKCRHGGFCEDTYFEASFDMVFPATYHFGSTHVAGNGQTGNFSETVKYYSGGLAFKKYFLKHSRLKPVLGVGLG